MTSKKSQGSLRTTLWKALIFDANLYEYTRNNVRNQRLARTIVILAAVSHVLGSAVILLINLATLPIFVLALLLDGISVVAGYYFWTLTIWKIGQWLKPNHVNYKELLIPIGFAYAPQVLNFLTLIPLLGRPIERALAIWSLLTVIVAVRQGLDIRTIWAVSICLVGWPVIQLAISLIQLFEQFLVKQF